MAKRKEPPCEKCMPEIMPENKEAFEIYAIVCNQMIVSGMGDPIDINFASLKIVMDLFSIENQLECFKRVVLMARHIIKETIENGKVI